MWRNEDLCAQLADVKCCSHCGKQYSSSSKIETELASNPALPLWGRGSQKLKAMSQRGICIPMLQAALFPVDKKVAATQVSVHRWMNKQNVDYTYNRILGFSQAALSVNNLPANAGDVRDIGLILRPGGFSGVGNGRPLQYSCLKNPTDRGTWKATVHWVSRVGYYWSNSNVHPWMNE